MLGDPEPAKARQEFCGNVAPRCENLSQTCEQSSALSYVAFLRWWSAAHRLLANGSKGEGPVDVSYQFGDWQVDPSLGEIRRGTDVRRLQPRVFAVLQCLLDKPGYIVSTEEIIGQVWQGRAVEPIGVARNVAQIRQALGDDSRKPQYIETIPKRGYRTLAPVQRTSSAGTMAEVESETEVPPIARRTAQTANANAKLFWGNNVTSIGFGAALLVLAVGIAWYVLREPDVDAASVLGKSSEDAAFPPITAIAVMPFDDLSPDRNHQWLVDGMAEELIDSLGRIEGLRVRTRNSTAILKKQQAEGLAISEKLGVGSIVQGSILRADGTIAVLARWSRIEDGERLWSGRYEQAFENIFAVQREITVGIAEAIRAELGIEDASLSLNKQRYRTADVRAWESLQKGSLLLRDYHLSLGPAKLLQVREQFRRALEFDPNYAQAYAFLALTDYENPDGQIQGAKRVLRMDPTNLTAHDMLIEDSMLHWDFETAELMLGRLVAANPIGRHLQIRHRLYLESGRLQAALDVAKRRVQVDPMDAGCHTRLGHTYLLLGDVANAIEHLEHGIAFAREAGQMGYWPIHSHYDLALAYHLVDRDAEAIRELYTLAPEAEIDLTQTWEEANLFVAQRLEVREANSPSPLPMDDIVFCTAHLLVQAGAKERAYACLQKWIGGDKYPFREIRVHPAFDPIRDEQRFQSLVQRLEKRIAEAAGTYEGIDDV
jgi:TolB-like protein/DNA-binding winged helix-turn-helix (wHTH) protein